MKRVIRTGVAALAAVLLAGALASCASGSGEPSGKEACEELHQRDMALGALFSRLLEAEGAARIPIIEESIIRLHEMQGIEGPAEFTELLAPVTGLWIERLEGRLNSRGDGELDVAIIKLQEYCDGWGVIVL